MVQDITELQNKSEALYFDAIQTVDWIVVGGVACMMLLLAIFTVRKYVQSQKTNYDHNEACTVTMMNTFLGIFAILVIAGFSALYTHEDRLRDVQTFINEELTATYAIHDTHIVLKDAHMTDSEAQALHDWIDKATDTVMEPALLNVAVAPDTRYIYEVVITPDGMALFTTHDTADDAPLPDTFAHDI